LGKILGRYVLWEVVVTFVVVTAVLLVVLLADQVAAVLERAAVNQFPQGVVLQLIWLGALQNLSILIPVGLLLGVVLAFGRMYHDSEMAAALACGVGPGSVYRPVALLAILGSMADCPAQLMSLVQGHLAMPVDDAVPHTVQCRTGATAQLPPANSETLTDHVQPIYPCLSCVLRRSTILEINKCASETQN